MPQATYVDAPEVPPMLSSSIVVLQTLSTAPPPHSSDTTLQPFYRVLLGAHSPHRITPQTTLTYCDRTARAQPNHRHHHSATID
jgi:hypothetical protein